MEVVPQQLNIFERFNRWIQESIMVKLFSIGFLILILLIPSSWIDDLIGERQNRAEQVLSEVSDKWSGSQTLSGPVLVIPYRKQEVVEREKEGKEIFETTEKAFFLPEQLDIKGKIDPESLRRGMFDVVVYESALNIKSTFAVPDFKKLSIPDDMILWKDAYMVFGITDLRGIKDNLTFAVDNNALTAEPSHNIGIDIKQTKVETNPEYTYTAPEQRVSLTSSNGIIVKLDWEGPVTTTKNVDLNLKLNGSRRLDFVPVGKTTSVNLSGGWADPSFDGEFIPTDRNVTETGFTATWKILHFNRPFAQQWKGGDQQLTGSNFGMKLLVPVDQYQKSTRTSKYSVLIILLTFMALFLVEITQKIRIHPFQYILVGAALTIYYALLLSLSEHIGYNIAYMIASVATVILISLYSISFLHNSKLTLLFSTVLVVVYTFIYVIILQQDFSLLIGSIGLFLIIGMLMYFSRRVNWYHEAVA